MPSMRTESPFFDFAACGGRISVRSSPQGRVNGGSSDRMPVTMMARIDSRMNCFQLMLSSQRAYAMRAVRTAEKKRVTPRTEAWETDDGLRFVDMRPLYGVPRWPASRGRWTAPPRGQAATGSD